MAACAAPEFRRRFRRGSAVRGSTQDLPAIDYRCFFSWRVWLVVITQVIYYGIPWLQWNDRQAVLFDLGARKFYIFGLVLWPQDVIYLAVLLVISAFALFLFTAIAGRLFCGYACPQTVYTEMFMWIERRVEGDRIARIRLDGDPWSVRKFRLKATKHSLWVLIALWTGFTFIGYFAPIRELGADILHFAIGPWQAFWMFFYAFATWGNAGFMREQVCKYMCPYARFQSVMVDRDTYVVTTMPAAASRAAAARGRSTIARKGWATVSIAAFAYRCVRPASISVTACSTSALGAERASTPVIRSWTRWRTRVALSDIRRRMQCARGYQHRRRANA